MKYLFRISIFVLIFASAILKADPWLLDEEEMISLKIPLVELPYNFSDGLSFPGMRQSFYYSESWSMFIHENIGYFLEASGCTQSLAFIAVGAYDYFLEKHTPLGSVWLLNEWKQSILGIYGYDSENNIYDFTRDENAFHISNISDADLSELKEKHPADFIRLSSAAYEVKIETVRSLREKYFFSGRHPKFMIPYTWMTLGELAIDVTEASLGQCDDYIDDLNSQQSAVSSRGVTGCFVTTYVYDLFHPHEVYSARGTHPSGTGVDRYIKYSDLSDDEKEYLEEIRYYNLLNFLSPSLIGLTRFEIDDDGKVFWNFAFSHYLTPFGHSTNFDLLLKIDKQNYILTLHSYKNYENSLPGLDFKIYRLPFEAYSQKFLFSGKCSFWLQPEDLMFFEEDSSIGGLVAAELIWSINYKFELFTEVSAKTAGWSAGEPSLEAGVSMLAGLNILF